MNEVSGSPIPLDSFSPAVARNIDPKSPVPVRMMAAKGLLACPPRELLSAVFVLTFDPDPKVAETAHGFGAKLPDKLMAGLRDEEIETEVLDFYARALHSNAQALEIIALNPNTADKTIASIADFVPQNVAEIIAQNQLRILRDEGIVRSLLKNPNIKLNTKETLLDFCVRSGMFLADLAEFVDARRRVFGEDPKTAEELQQAEQHTVEKVVAEYGTAVTDEAAQVEEGKRLTFTQRVMKMSVSQKIKLATLGNKEARTMLLRDSNKLVALAAISSPRITEAEVVTLANSRTLHDDVMRFICRNREWLKNYQIKTNLVNNPKTPVATSLKLMKFLHPNELKGVARNKNVNTTIQLQAKRMLQPQSKGA
jgi:hypothetical protein